MIPYAPDAPPAGSAVISLLVSDVPGTLDRVFALVRRQGCGVYSLTLVPSDTGGLSTLTLTLTGGHPQRLVPQLARIVAVHRVTVLRSGGSTLMQFTNTSAAAPQASAGTPTHNED